MKNLPEKLYLNFGCDESDMPDDFKELDSEFVTWSEDQIEKGDPLYIREDVFYKKLLSKLHLIESGNFSVAEYIDYVKNKLP